MRLLFYAAGLLVFALGSSGVRAQCEDQYAFWHGETYFFDDDTFPEHPYQHICREDKEGYSICFNIHVISTIPILDKPKDYGFKITLSVEHLVDDPARYFSTTTWPVVKIDGEVVQGIPNRDISSKSVALWTVAIYEQKVDNVAKGDWHDTKYNFDKITTGKTVSAVVTHEDGSEHSLEFPLNRVKSILYAMLPTCCRNPE